MGQVARVLVGEFMASHCDPVLIQQYFSSKLSRNMDLLMEGVYDGIPVDATNGGNLAKVMQHGNHCSDAQYKTAMWKNVYERYHVW